MAFLDTLIFGYRQIVDGSNVLLLQRSKVKFVGAGSVVDDVANAQTVVTLTGNSSVGADGTGFSNITGNIKNTSNPKVVAIQYPINTSNGTTAATTVLTVPTTTGKTYSIRGIVAIANSPASAFGEFEINAYARNNLGMLTLESNTTTAKVNAGGFTVALVVSGTNLVVNVTDPGPFRRITGEIYVAERSF